jgi:peptidoglycan/LPS O-acetylase OafA/YrhL
MRTIQAGAFDGVQAMNTHALQPAERNHAFAHLRAFVTVLVVAHHAVLAYHPYAPPARAFDSALLTWAAFPIVDTQRWSGIDLFVGFNDAFFMALMFLLSGLFVGPSLQRKGSAAFLRERGLRLGLPFLLCAAILAPLAYYPAWLQIGSDSSLSAYARAWLSLGVWPAGPAWFLWVLFAFDVLAVLACRMAPRWAESFGRFIGTRSPLAFFGWLAAIGAAVYVPLTLIVNPMTWASFGPFFVQTARVPLYASYFAIGIALGAWGIERGVFAAAGKLARRWWLWPNVAILAYAVLVGLFIAFMIAASKQQRTDGLELAASIAFTVSCAASSLSLIAIFLRYGQRPSAIFESLSRNAYGIYIVHYVFVIWLQFALLGANLPGAAKGSLVFLGALGASWMTVAGLRRVPAIARVI